MWGYEGAGGISTILESTIAQNLLAMKGICPRVYDLVEVEGKTCQVTDFLEGKNGAVSFKDDRFSFYKDDCDRDHNYLGGKLFDLQGTKLKNYSDYKNYVISELIRRNGAHGHANRLYQSTDYHPGLRDTQERIKKYSFKNFKDKFILDIGCNNGMMCREAYDLGAKRVVGIDWPDMAEMAQELAILDGYYNIDFYGADIKNLNQKDLQKITGIDKFNIHLFLAMEAHVGWPEWVKNCDTLYYEGHGTNRPFEVFNYNLDKND
jgi:SAM-dependent methyltransferase